MSQPAYILVVDDETNIRLTLSALLTRAGYSVTEAATGEEAVELLKQRPFDLMLVDLKMPGIDGMQVVAAARDLKLDSAIIVLTGHGTLETAVEGLHHGIFDYLLKTTDPVQVVERVKAALEDRTQKIRQRELLDVVGEAVKELRGPNKQAATGTTGGAAERLITVGELQLDTWHQVATLADRSLSLTPTEFRVLLCLAEHAGQMLSYAQLVRCAQGYDTSEIEAGELIKPHIHHLRQKLEPDPASPRYLLNVRGKGYILQLGEF
ncbi:MAG: response regulator transcription factor [Chloroflexaceae bacterium]